MGQVVKPSPEIAMLPALAGYLEMDIPALTGSAKLGQGRVSTQVRIPLQSIKAGVDYYELVMKNESIEPKVISE